MKFIKYQIEIFIFLVLVKMYESCIFNNCNSKGTFAWGYRKMLAYRLGLMEFR